MIRYIADQYNLDAGELRWALSMRFPSIDNQKRCPNCDASMQEYIFTLDCLDALLVYGMGQIVKDRVAKGKPLSEANAVHLQSELNNYYSVPSRSTQCSKLGLIAKVLHEDGSHNQNKGWLITERGFRFLRGDPVPKYVKVWRGQIEDRYADTVTITEAFKMHRDRVERAISARRDPKSDYRPEIAKYSPTEWIEFAGTHTGHIL